MNINEEIQKATDSFIEEKLPAMVSEKVGKMVDSILDDVFRAYSDTAKQIKSKIEEKLDINLQRFDLVDYNAMVSRAINDQLIGIVNEQAITPIMSLVENTVGFVKKKTIKLSEIHDLVIDAAKEDNDETAGEISFYVVKNDKYGWYTVAFDIDGDKSQNECALEFLISTDPNNETIFSFKSSSHWSVKSKLTPSKITQLSNLEHKIFRLYSAQVKVEIDETRFDNEWERYEY